MTKSLEKQENENRRISETTLKRNKPEREREEESRRG
jgi:hypothetical protein